MVRYLGKHDLFYASGICVRLEIGGLVKVFGLPLPGWRLSTHREADMCVRAGNIFKDLLVEVKDLG